MAHRISRMPDTQVVPERNGRCAIAQADQVDGESLAAAASREPLQ